MTNKNTLKDFLIASAMYSLGSILGPLLVFGGVGFILDRIFDTKPWLLLGSLFLAFITTQVLLFKKIAKINKMMTSQIRSKTKVVDSSLINDKDIE